MPLGIRVLRAAGHLAGNAPGVRARALPLPVPRRVRVLAGAAQWRADDLDAVRHRDDGWIDDRRAWSIGSTLWIKAGEGPGERLCRGDPQYAAAHPAVHRLLRL